LVTDVGSRNWLGSTVSSCGAVPSASTPFDSTLVLGFTTGNERTLAGLRRAFERASGRTIAPSAFYDRFTPALARRMRAVLADRMAATMAAETGLDGFFSSFRDVLSIDSRTRGLDDATLLRLKDLLAKRFPATRTNPTLAVL
jgi:hypothetical protein